MTSFNPASFSVNSPAAQRRERAEAPTRSVHPMVRELEQAAARFALRRDGFAIGKSDTCLDIAAKLERFGSFVSEKQEDFARKLVEWSKPFQRETVEAVKAVQASIVQARTSQAIDLVREHPACPKLFDLMQRLSKLTIGKLQVVRKNQDSLCWIKHEDAEKVIGRLTDGGMLTLWQRPMVDLGDVMVDLLRIEVDPEAAAALHGKLSGRCSVCSRDLTDPESIERGIGPVCLTKF
jgi:Family of unknown function (DUF6011)